ncbi:MAG: NmrA family protein [Deltaproteobacteria bacterium]|nr:NmrA family protein [Deltaproteobacteria bacterium]
MSLELPVLVVAGASGFVGRALGRALTEEHRFRIVGLSRGPHEPGDGYDAWRSVDLFSLLDTERALEGASMAVYLVHSMMPHDGLTQARFEDLDLLCADNFGRAAAKAGVRQIVYLGGLVPRVGELSDHLKSRTEVEGALAAHGVPVTTLRAGMVVGPGGSSFEMLARLVERLPVMLCPAWTSTRSQPIALEDAVRLLSFAIDRRECFGRTYDVGGPDVLTYREMMQLTADALGKRRRLISVPWFSPSISTLWVSLVSGASPSLVGPLVQSLRHEMVARDRELADRAGVVGVPFREVLAESVRAIRSMPRSPSRASRRSASPLEPRRDGARAAPKRVRSVQRLVLPSGRHATWAATEYFRWLERAMRPFLRVELSEGDAHARIAIAGTKLSLLELRYSKERSTHDRPLLYIVGGLLSNDDGRGRLELRELRGTRTMLAAIHDYIPRIPWFLYRRTQALGHLWVMWRFARYLARTPDTGGPAGVTGVTEPQGS